jgi:hypothetical protein
MGELKTEMEAMKLQLITKWASGIVLGVGVSVVLTIKLL